MTEDSGELTLREKITAAPLLVYPLALGVMAVGWFTGDFVGFYAQSQIAGQIQIALIPVMMTAPFIWLWGWDDDRREHD